MKKQQLRSGTSALVIALGLSLGIFGCSDDNGPIAGSGGDGGSGGTGGTAGAGGDGGTGGGVEPGAVTATPATSTFNPTATVELTTESGDPIYYTDDLTPVLDEEGNLQGEEYTGPDRDHGNQRAQVSHRHAR